MLLMTVKSDSKSRRFVSADFHRHSSRSLEGHFQRDIFVSYGGKSPIMKVRFLYIHALFTMVFAEVRRKVISDARKGR